MGIREEIAELEKRCSGIEENVEPDVRIAIQRILRVERLELELARPWNMGEKIARAVRDGLSQSPENR